MLQCTYEILQPVDIPGIILLNKAVYGVDIPREYWHWKYFEHPTDNPPSIVIKREGEIVGMQGYLAVTLAANGTMFRGVKETDLAIREDYRRIDVYLGLLAFASELLASGGRAFTLGIGNEAGTEAGESLAGKFRIGPMKHFLKICDLGPRLGPFAGLAAPVNAVLGLADVLRPRPRGTCRVFTCDSFDARFDDVLMRMRTDNCVWPIRDALSLIWRYLNAAHLNVDIFAVEDTAERMLGYCVAGQPVTGANGRGTIFEIVVPDVGANIPAVHALITAAVAALRKRGVSVIDFWTIGLPGLERAFSGAGFMRRKRQSPTVLAQWIDQEESARFSGNPLPGELFLSTGDIDAV